MAHSVSFSDRAGAGIQAPYVSLFVETYSHTATSGPFTARITATGERGELRRLLDMLRYGVDIFDEAGGWRWGGYIHTVQYNLGRITVTSSMDDVANRCTVGYTYQAPNGQQQADQSTVATDTESIALYGEKEQLFTRTNISYAVAQRIADSALADKRFPKKRLEIGSGVERGKVVITCRGWGETLYWVGGGELSGSIDNMSDPTGYTAPSNIKQNYLYNHGDNAENQTIQFGDTTAKLYTATGFTVSGSAPVQITDIKLKVVQIGNPTDDLLVEIRTGVAPWNSIVVSTGVIKNANIKAVHTWTSVSSITPGWLLPGSTFWITMHRSSGTADAAKYFRWAAYTGGGVNDGYTYQTSVGGAAVTTFLIPFIDISMGTRGRMLIMGANAASQQIAQSVSNISSVGYNFGKVKVRVGKVGSPSGPLFLNVYPDSAGQPGAVSYYSQSLTTVTTEATYTFTFPTSGIGNTSHAPSDVVWLVFSTTLVDPNNYYYLLATEAGHYTDGNVLTYNGSIWLVPPGELDLYFSAEAVRMTTDQISDMITTSTAGQFLTGCDRELPSNIFSNVKRDTDISAGKHIQNLLNAGASDGSKMLMQVTRERRVRVFREPAQGANDYILTSDGRLLTLFDDPDTKARVVAGVWARVNDTDVVAAVGAEPALFIEKAEYNAINQTVSYQVRGQINPYDVMGL